MSPKVPSDWHLTWLLIGGCRRLASAHRLQGGRALPLSDLRRVRGRRVHEWGSAGDEVEEEIKLQVSVIHRDGRTANRPRHEQKLRASADRT
jgi:hypothetical protein